MRSFGLLLPLALLVGCDNMSPTPTTTNSPSTNQPRTNDDGTTGAVVDPSTRRDNTAVNERDQDPATKTPFDQGQDTRNINLTAQIRQKVVGHSGLSTNAHNVKIISEDGKVTLRGPVKSQEEKDIIDTFAKDSAGADKVDNQLEIAP